MTKYLWLTTSIMLALCLLSVASARSATVMAQQQYSNDASTSKTDAEDQARHASAGTLSSGIWRDMSLAFRVYKHCAQENLSVCLKVKLLAGLERAMRSGKVLKIIEGVQLVQNDEASTRQASESHPTTTFNSETEIEAALPRTLEAKEQTLRDLIINRLTKLLRDRVLYVHMPFLDSKTNDELTSNTVEGRKKKDKKGGGGAYIMIPLLLGGTFVPIAYGALAMLAGKALIVSKLALVLASIIGIKKLLSGGGGKESSHEVVVSSGGHSGWGRDMDLAYSGWKPAAASTKEMTKTM